jgi:hypothetical protein
MWRMVQMTNKQVLMNPREIKNRVVAVTEARRREKDQDGRNLSLMDQNRTVELTKSNRLVL